MAINLEKIQSALDRFDPEKKKSNNSSGSDNMIKLDEGEHTIRIVPYKYDEEMPFREFNFHYRINDRTFVCPEKHGNQKCPVCSFVKTTWAEYNKTEDETFKDLAKSMSVSTRVFIPIIVKEGPNKDSLYSPSNTQARWWSISASNSPRSTYNKILNAAKIALKRNIDITDVNQGMDLIVQVEKGFNDWVYPVDISLDITPSTLVDGNQQDFDAVIDSVENIDNIFPMSDVNEIKEALDAHLNPAGTSEETNNSSMGSAKSYSSAKEDEDDLPFDEAPIARDNDAIGKKFAGILGSNSN
jgi:hypothetical protein